MTRRALSLVETILASFLLIAGFALMTSLFHAAMRYSVRIDSLQLAVLLAEKRMEEIRAWSWQVHSAGTAFSNWSAVPANPTDPDFPGYTLAVATTPHTLYSPCSEFESLYPGDQRAFDETARLVTVTVRWGGRQHALTSLVAAPSENLDRVEVTPGNNQSVARDGVLPLSAVGRTPSGQAIPDLKFVWYIDQAGVGSLVDPRRRDGTATTFQHRVVLDGVVGYGTGTCQIKALARMGPRTVVGASGTLTLP
ncbi:MAG: hypothetical protein AB1758_26470 [Candidatus Eremiobacterota bacterium]